MENSTNYLGGAVFRLEYRTDSSETFTNLSNSDVEELDENSKFTVPITGITLRGLVDGEYRLQEITPPKGYVITEKYPVVFSIANGTITNTEGTSTGVRYSALTTSFDDTFIVPNTPGAALPSTGGPGTSRIYLLGSILTGLALAGLVMGRQRRHTV